MRIDINQKKIAFGDKYEIVQDGKTILKAASKLFRFLSEINLFRPDSEQNVARIKRKFNWFKALYSIEMNSGSDVLFETVSYWKNHYRCEYRGSVYDIYGHRGRKFSIYKNSKQVAWFEKEAVTFFDGDNYKIIANDDADNILIICFALVVDNYRSNRKNKGAISFDIGNIFQAKPFDESWSPKEDSTRKF